MPTAGLPNPFQNGIQMVAGEDLNAAIGRPHLSYEYGIVAAAGGGRTNAYLLRERISQIETVATLNDSVCLPASRVGSFRVVTNIAANACQVFATGSDTINATAGSTGVSLAAGKTAIFACAKSGRWNQLLSA